MHGPFIEKLESLHRLLLRESSLPPAPPKGREGRRTWPRPREGKENENENENHKTCLRMRTLCLLLEPDDWEKTDEELLLTSKDVRKKVNPMLGKIVQHQFMTMVLPRRGWRVIQASI